MKPIIVDMRDMSDSTEVYESRPNPVLAGFIYLILAMVIVAFIWMGFFKMDVVVDAMGTVAAAEEVATITNQVSGTITGRMIEDGQTVQKGDVLYTISHEEQTIQLTALEKQLEDSENREEMLRLYDGWLQDGTDFTLGATDNPYYSEIATRKMLVELQGASSQQLYSKELSAYETKLNVNADMEEYYSDAIAKSRQLVEAIKSRNNPFNSGDTYYYNYMENYIVQYQNIGVQYESKANTFRNERKNVEQSIKGLEEQIEALKTQMAEAVYLVMLVSGGDAMDATASDAQQAELSQLEQQLAALKSSLETVDSGISDALLQKDIALASYEKESIASVESTIRGYEQNLNSYEGTKQEYANGKNTLKEQGVELELENLMAQETYSVAEELEVCRQTRQQLEQQISSLQKNIENATVRATMSGTVNLASGLVEGDYLSAGTTVLTIIPQAEDSAFIVKSYVENTDIAKIHEGMEVTYEIGAYPSREYGTMTGEVTFVSVDLKVSDNGSAYYVVETSVNPGELRNRIGEEAALKVGMLCETKVIIESKSVLEILLEKLFKL